MAIGGGRIDRLDVMQEEDRVYVKIIDYKTGNTSFDLVSIYYGLQMQLVVYMDAAMQGRTEKTSGLSGKTGRNLLITMSKIRCFRKKWKKIWMNWIRRFSKS